jgi:hypothetical protein
MIMRDFFKDELKALERKTGLKQYEKILAAEKWEIELKELLDELCRVCNQFDYIPNEDKAKIIRQNILTDQEFIGFNARIIYKWLLSARSVYFKELAHQEQQEEQKPILEGAARDAKLKEWLAALGDGVKAVPQLSPTEVKREGRIEVEKKVTGYVPDVDPVEWERQYQLRKQYRLENYNVITGEKLPTWISEQEWIKKQEQFSNESKSRR